MAKCIANSSLGTAPDTYLYTLAQHGNTFATIGSDDSLRMFDISLKPLRATRTAHRSISCLTTNRSGFVTAGRDGLIRCWDARGSRCAIELTEPKGNGLSSIACHEHLVAAGTESSKEGLADVSVLVYDTRNASSPVRSYVESHTDTITQLAFHTSQPNLLLSGSTDGLVSIFDIGHQDEDDALQQVLNPRAAVHCAGFLSPSEVYIVTTDEHFTIHSLGDPDADAGSSVLDIGDVRENLRCMYVIDISNGSQPVMACGHNVNQELSIVQLDASESYEFTAAIDLPGAHGEEVVRDLLVLEEQKKALSCGEDGHVKVWDLSAAKPRAMR